MVPAFLKISKNLSSHTCGILKKPTGKCQKCISLIHCFLVEVHGLGQDWMGNFVWICLHIFWILNCVNILLIQKVKLKFKRNESIVSILYVIYSHIHSFIFYTTNFKLINKEVYECWLEQLRHISVCMWA